MIYCYMMSEEYIQLSNHTNIISTCCFVKSLLPLFSAYLVIRPYNLFIIHNGIQEPFEEVYIIHSDFFYVYHECTVGKKPIKAQMHIEYTHGIRLCNLVLI